MNEKDIAAILTGLGQGARNFSAASKETPAPEVKPDLTSPEWTPEEEDEALHGRLPVGPEGNPNAPTGLNGEGSPVDANGNQTGMLTDKFQAPKVSTPGAMTDPTQERIQALLTGQQQPSYSRDAMMKAFNEKMASAKQLGFMFGRDEQGNPTMRYDFFQPHLISADGGNLNG